MGELTDDGQAAFDFFQAFATAILTMYFVSLQDKRAVEKFDPLRGKNSV